MYITTEPAFSYPQDEAFDSGYSEVGSSGPNSPCPLSPPCSPNSFSNSFSNSFREPYGYVTYVPIYNVLYPQAQPPCFTFPPCDLPVSVPVEPAIIPSIVEQMKHVPTSPSTTPTSNSPPVGRLIKWTLPPPNAPMFPLPGWDPMPYAMEHFWQTAFAWFFRPLYMTYNHIWTLTPTNAPPPADEWPWHFVSYSAKVRFQCQYKHGWTSMKGRVTFWFRMRRHGDQIICEALFKLYGQQCNRCNSKRLDFLTPLWYHEEIENAIRTLSIEVAKIYYGGDNLPMPRRLRQGNPSRALHHDPSRCQACLEGICVVRY